MTDGGYDDGYSAVPCLWGREPGSLVAEHLAAAPNQHGRTVYDLGCGEGKNAAAFAIAGADVIAVDCSAHAIANGKQAWPGLNIDWICGDVREALLHSKQPSDHVVMYGLMHCLPDEQEVRRTLSAAKALTKPGGHHFLVAFNDGPHDLSAHPGFNPLLLPHSTYVDMYGDWEIMRSSDSVLHETHPHNSIPHFHSVSRIVARRP